MRMRLNIWLVAASIVAAPSAHAQQTSSTPAGGSPAAPPAGAASPQAGATTAQTSDASAPTGEIDLGFRATIFGDNSNEARFQRYRDLRNGPTLDRLRWSRDTDRVLFEVAADHAGYRDQHYYVSLNDFGRGKATFEWRQTPLFYSEDTSTLYYTPSLAELRIPDPTIPQRVQAGTLKLSQIAATGALQPFDLRQRRDVAALTLVASPWTNVDASFSVKTSHKNGQQPWAESFGFNLANEVPAPLDHRTTDLNASLEWANDRGMARVAWDGSWFNNAVESLIADSPSRVTDTTNPTAYVTGNGTSHGRMALWPDSTAQTVSAGAAYNLPWRSRVNGVVSIGNWDQNASLLPYTINTAIPQIPLDRLTADASARVTAFNVNFTSRPNNVVWFNVRGRRYDFDNRTPVFHVTNYVRIDQVVEPSVLGQNEPFGYTRDSIDADASFTFIPYTALRVGYTGETDDRTYRVIESTTQHTLRASIDTVGNQYVTIRVGYEHAKRRGTGIDELALDEIGEQASLRQFDISDLDRNAVNAQVQVAPFEPLALTAQVVVGRDTRPDANFGLLSFDNTTYSVGADVTFPTGVAVGLSYGHERNTSSQKSRQADPGPQFADPTRDWFTNLNDRIHYLAANLDLIKTIPRSDVRFALDWNKSSTDYRYVLPANSALSSPSQLPTLLNELKRVTLDYRYTLTSRIGIGLSYWYDAYRVDDFALSPQYVYGQRTLTDGVMLGYFFRPYTANTITARLMYVW